MSWEIVAVGDVAVSAQRADEPVHRVAGLHWSCSLGSGLLLALLTCLTADESRAQTIRGVVLNEATSEAIAGAEVALVDANGNHLTRTETDPAGLFLLHCEPGRFSFQIRRVGLTPILTNEFTFPGDSAQLSVTVLVSAEPVAVLLPGITVESEAIPRGKMRGFYQRQLDGFGYYITREEIESYHPRVFTDIMRRIPGVSVEPAGFGRGNVMKMRVAGLGGACAPLIFLDGVLVPRDEFPDTYLEPSDVAGIEVYKGGATTPARFNITNSACGVVVVWTR